MITKGLNERMMIVRLGYGLISLSPGVTIDKKVFLSLHRCDKSEIGKDLPKTSKVYTKEPFVRLLFSNTKSIDALILKLQDIKSLMIGENDNEFTTRTAEESHTICDAKNRNLSTSQTTSIDT